MVTKRIIEEINGTSKSRQIPKAPPGNGEFEHFGEFLRAVKRDGQFGYRGAKDSRLVKDMGVGDFSGGGALIPEGFRNDLLVLGQDLALIRGRALEMAAPNGQLKIPTFEPKDLSTDDFGGIKVQWLKEGDTFASDTPALRQVRAETYKNGFMFIVSSGLVEDTPQAFGNYATLIAAAAYARSENRIFMRGTGVGQPLGMLNASSTIDVGKEVAQVANSVIYDNVLKMEARLLGSSWERANWYCHQSVLKELRQMTVQDGTGSGPVYQEGVGGRFLLGRPLLVTDILPRLGTRGDICLFDPTMYVIIDGPPMVIESSGETDFAGEKTQFRVKARTDGRPLLAKAVAPEVTLLPASDHTQSAYVTLETRG